MMFTRCNRLLLWNIMLVLLVLCAKAVTAQNIVSNPGFEIGKLGELPEEWSDQKEGGAEGKVVLTDRGARSGKQCLFIEHSNDAGYIHPNKDVEIKPGDYTFSLWAKSDEEINFEAQIYRRTDWGAPLSESCILKKGAWTRFEFLFSALEAIPGSIQIGLTNPGRLWLDDVELIRMGEVKKIANIQVWDTISPFSDQIDIQNRTDWEVIPEGTDPIKPQGDIVLENEYLTVAFGSKMGKVVIYSKFGKKKAEIIPLLLKDKAASISMKLLSNSEDAATIEAGFSAKGIKGIRPVVLSFSKKQIIEVKPAADTKGISLLSPIEFAVVPSFISDDLIFKPGDYSVIETLYLPSENLFMGLLNGEDSVLFVVWPKSNQELKLNPDEKNNLFESIDFESDGESLYLAILDAPGIWHKEELKPSYLEKTVAINWKRPFPAKWATQLYEDELKTTYSFRESEPQKDGFWRAGVGSYTYPVWFKGEEAYYHLGKKIPPKGESIIYFLERKGTPVSVSTPIDIIKQTLDDQTYASIVDPEGRQNRSLTRPNCAVGTATCEVTDKLKLVFEAGEEVEKKDYVKGGAEDMVYFLTEERERAEEYQAFAREMIDFLALTRKDKPELKPFLDKMEEIARELIAAYEREKENIKELEYARELAKQTASLTEQKSPENYVLFMSLKLKWTGMGGAIDDLNRKLHTITRKLFQEAGYSSVNQREAIKIAEEIRKRTIKCLRRPGHYEIWSDY